MASDFKRGYVCGTPEEGNIVIKEEMEDEAAFVDLLMRQNDHQNDGGPYRAGNVGQLNIKEEAELTSEETPLAIASKPLFKLANVKPGPTFACTVCRASFPDKATTLEHIRTSHSSNGHYRQRATKSKEDEAAKSTTTKGNKPIIIYWSAIPTPHPSQEVENRDFLSQTGLAIHERVHQSETARGVMRKEEKSEAPRMGRGRGRSLSCPLCPRILHRSWEMPEHLELHQQASPPTCSLCGAVYKLEQNVAVHRAMVHPEAVEPPKPKKQKVRPAPEKKEKPKKIKSSTEDLAESTSYPCHLCPSVYTLRNSLNQHTRRKHPPPGAQPLTGRHLCDQCGKAFISAYNLANHTRLHTGERPYHCAECPYRGSTRTNLTKHQKVHLKEPEAAVTEPMPKPFSCTACPRSFTHSSKLAKHAIDHTLPYPFVCPQCGALYPTSAPLQRHQTLVHPTEDDGVDIKRDSGMKRWICPLCPRRFSHKDKLYTHLEQHKDPASPQCTLCGVVYRLESHLQLHQVRVHQMGELKTGKICSEDHLMSGDDQMSSNLEWPVPEESREWGEDLEEDDYDLEEDDEEEEEIVFCKTVL